VLRPNIAQVIEKDISLLHAGALLLEKLWSDGKRLRPRAVVGEFEKTLRDELDLTREAANCSQLRRNFERSPLLLVPAVHWDYCGTEVMVMERMNGIPIAQVDRLREAGIDIPRLARAGVEVFFTQVFRDAISMPTCTPAHFRRDRGPEPRQVHRRRLRHQGHGLGARSGLLAQNFLAFFRRDYHRVATAHPNPAGAARYARGRARGRDTRRAGTVFDRPLSEISLGRVLLQLFCVAPVTIEIQPQLVLLQRRCSMWRTRRQLDPNLDSGDGAALSRTLDGRPIGLPALKRRLRRGALHRRRVAGVAAARP
jgi:ubiquinone biosynthesis protein